MKPFFWAFALPILLLFYACDKGEGRESPTPLAAQDAQLLEDWIGLHLQVIRNTTGVTHVAYSRHFAYAGVAVYEALVQGDHRYRSMADKVSGTLDIPEPPQGKPLFWPAAANAAMADMLRYFYPAKPANLARIDSMEQAWQARYAGQVVPAGDIDDAVAFGRAVAAAVITWSALDGADAANIPYTPLGEGYWKPLPNTSANVPGWGNNRTILPGSILNTLPPAPVPFSPHPGSPFHAMASEVYNVSQTLTNEQRAIALFWDDAPNGSYVSAFGHWFSILRQVLAAENPNLMVAADAYLRLGVSMHDAIISTWQAKYTFHQMRPVTYIREHMGIEGWIPVIGTPPHPEYTAAHGTLSAAAAFALESVFGASVSFTDHTYDDIGMSPRTYPNFDAAGREAGLSRLYGGIHFRPSIDQGYAMGRKVGQQVKALLKTRA